MLLRIVGLVTFALAIFLGWKSHWFHADHDLSPRSQRKRGRHAGAREPHYQQRTGGRGGTPPQTPRLWTGHAIECRSVA